MPTRIFSLIFAGLLLFAFIGTPPVQRTQEARVLETARQMTLGHGLQDWLVPHLNGRPRLQKPPLAYWMAAVGFEVGGVNDFAGRFLFGLCGLGSLATCYGLARKLFDARVAAVTAGLLLSSYLFFRYSRLAETDAPAALFVTIAIGLITSAALPAPSSTSPRKQFLCFHLAAVAMALAGLAKGPPLFFPIVFLIFASFAVRANLVWRFIRSGAPITLLVIVLPWYAYIIHLFGFKTFYAELHNNLEGGDHGGSFLNYGPWLLMGLLPWTGFALLALIGLSQMLWRSVLDFFQKTDVAAEVAGDRPRASRELKLLAAWIAAIALPLMLTGNKQVHYLLPLMPPLIVATAWFVSLVIFDDEPAHVRRLGRGTMIFTAVAAIAAGVASAILLHRQLPGAPASFLITPAVMVIGGAFALGLQRRSLRDALLALILTFAVVMPVGVGYLSARLMNHGPRQIAAEIRQRFGESPLVFYGPNLSLSLCYNLRQTIPVTNSPAALLAMRENEPGLIVIAQEKAGRTPAAPPAPFIADGEPVVTDDQVFTFYRVR